MKRKRKYNIIILYLSNHVVNFFINSPKIGSIHNITIFNNFEETVEQKFDQSIAAIKIGTTGTNLQWLTFILVYYLLYMTIMPLYEAIALKRRTNIVLDMTIKY